MVKDLLLIFVLQALYVTVTTVRWIIMVRGGRYLAAGISFFELMLYVVALGMVVTQLHNPARVVVYATGYAVGSLAGSWVEEWLAIGYTVLHIITKKPSDLPQKLREAGLGVTVWPAEGREGERLVLMAVARRRWAPQVTRMVAAMDDHAFIVAMEPKAFRGGFLLPFLRTGPWLTPTASRNARSN